MHLYRISKKQFADDLSGQGAKLSGGRWNKKGTAVIYTASSVALATLEVLVHAPLSIVPNDLALVVLQIPSDLPYKELSVESLPVNWSNYPAPSRLSKLGNDWADSQETLSLRVPSSVVPDASEQNILLNPSHPDSSRIEVIEIKDYHFDDRLLRSDT